MNKNSQRYENEMMKSSFLLEMALSILLLLLVSQSSIAQRNGTPVNVSNKNTSFPRNWILKNWEKAGVAEVRYYPKKTLLIGPSDSIQKVIEILSKSGGGIVLLEPGEYIVRHTIRLESNVILRGIQKDSVLLSIKIHGYHFSSKKPRQSALYIGNKQFVGIENLTLKYTDTSFEPFDKASLSSSWDKAVFHIRDLRDTSLFVEHIWIDRSENCWVKNCNLICAGSSPMMITDSKHITCCNNHIDRSYNKCDGGMGYYDITNSSFVLIQHERIHRIRHFAIQKGSSNNVIINNYLEVDINFHDGDLGNNLIAGNTIRIPEWHSWHCFSRGDPKQHRPPGENNVLFNNDAVYKTGKAELSETDVAYLINSTWSKDKAFPLDLKKSDKKKLNKIVHDKYPN